MKIFKKSEPKTEAKKEFLSPKPDFISELKNTNFKDVGTWSEPVRLGSFIAICLATTIASSLFMVQPIINKIDFVKQQRETLYEKYRTDKTKLVTAQQTEKQLKEIENNFIFQLSQLPTESEIPDLVE
ncbi:TPA: type 4a pilus biogenesis protein PilO, partial [Acinetobacter baumannii]|nr:type 4a pilus biogenesis protein PilO [Acinetobacter baumannii]